MIAAAALLLPVVTALLAAASLRLPSLVSTLLAGYLALVVATAGAALALSPFRAVTQGGLAAFESALLVATALVWWRRGRPVPATDAARAVVRAVLGRPETALFLAAVGLLLAYELTLALTVPPNNYDALTYHLSRAASWVQHSGVYWIPNAPTDRMNEFQPLAEQEVLYLFAATGRVSLFALPQFVASLAILVAVFGAARRLGFEARAAACGTFLLATYSLVALESSTAQNDLVAASFTVVAACLLLGNGRVDAALGGVAAGLAPAAKLTTALVFPVLVWLALLRRRRTAAIALGAAVAAFVAIGMWGFVLNLVHTGHLLGHGGGRVENTASPSWPWSAVTGLYLLYSLMDLSVLSHRLIDVMAATGIAAGLAISVLAARSRRSAAGGIAVAVPFVAPLLAIGCGGAMAYVARAWGHPIRGVGGTVGDLSRSANEDYSAFGPIGAVLVLGVPLLIAADYIRGKADSRRLALAAATPLFLVLLVLESKWNEFLTRFLLVPVVLAAPLLSRVFRSRMTTAAYLVAASIVAALTITHAHTKPLESPYGHPWQLSQASALAVARLDSQRAALEAYDRLVPPHACVGAVFGVNVPGFPIYGSRFEHRVEYLTTVDSQGQAIRQGLFYVVLATNHNGPIAATFRANGWRVRELGPSWLLASEPAATDGAC